MKRSCESDLASANGSVRRIRFGCSQLGAASIYVKQACSRTIQTSSADRFVRGAHHRRCAREGLIEAYDALCTRPVASSLGSIPLDQGIPWHAELMDAR